MAPARGIRAPQGTCSSIYKVDVIKVMILEMYHFS